MAQIRWPETTAAIAVLISTTRALQVTATSGGLAAALGPNVFTDIAFDSRTGLYGAAEGQLLYVSSASGALFQIDYTRSERSSRIFATYPKQLCCCLVTTLPPPPQTTILSLKSNVCFSHEDEVMT